MALDGNVVKRLMSQEGPVVDVVMLRANGKTEQLNVDMTPRLNTVSKLLGGQATFIGQFAQIDVTIMKLRDPEPQHARNLHKLPAPFNKAEVFGDILLVRMNEESEPESLTQSEYERFESSAPSAAVEEDGEEEEEEEEEEAELSPLHQALLDRVIAGFNAEHGREPTVDELEGIMGQLNETLAGAGVGEAPEDDDDDEYEEDEEEDGDDEADGDEDEDEEEESDDDGGEGENLTAEQSGLLQSLVSKFADEHDGRDPTEEEMRGLLHAFAAASGVELDGADDTDGTKKRPSPSATDVAGAKRPKTSAGASNEE